MSLIYKETKPEAIIIPSSAIRLRVIPNSNSSFDQKMKNKVKKYLEENTYQLLQDVTDIELARELIKNNIPTLKENINNIFNNNNYDVPYQNRLWV